MQLLQDTLATIGSILGWIVVIGFVSVCCLACLSVIVLRLESLVTGRVRIKSRRGLLAIFYVGVCLATINWLVGGGIIYGMIIGGDAFRGRIAGDEYYLGLGGEYTEVSQGFWWFSFWYQMASHLLLAFFIAGVAVLVGWGWIRGEKPSLFDTDMPRESLIDLVERIISNRGTRAEIDLSVTIFDCNCKHPAGNGLIFDPGKYFDGRTSPSAEEIVDKALSG
jgi:hypothetical protein